MSRAQARAEAEWARVQERTETRSTLERFNDTALEHLIALARIFAIAGVVLTVWLCPFLILWLGWLGVTLAVGHVVLTALSGWWGWWHMGNKEWLDGEGQ